MAILMPAYTVLRYPDTMPGCLHRVFYTNFLHGGLCMQGRWQLVSDIHFHRNNAVRILVVVVGVIIRLSHTNSPVFSSALYSCTSYVVYNVHDCVILLYGTFPILTWDLQTQLNSVYISLGRLWKIFWMNVFFVVICITYMYTLYISGPCPPLQCDHSWYLPGLSHSGGQAKTTWLSTTHPPELPQWKWISENHGDIECEQSDGGGSGGAERRHLQHSNTQKSQDLLCPLLLQQVRAPGRQIGKSQPMLNCWIYIMVWYDMYMTVNFCFVGVSPFQLVIKRFNLSLLKSRKAVENIWRNILSCILLHLRKTALFQYYWVRVQPYVLMQNMYFTKSCTLYKVIYNINYMFTAGTKKLRRSSGPGSEGVPEETGQWSLACTVRGRVLWSGPVKYR